MRIWVQTTAALNYNIRCMRIKKDALVLSVIYLATCNAFGQNNPSRALAKADCSRTNSPGCKSFNEMVLAKDTGIVAELTAVDNRVYVCFSPKKDTFHILRFPVPIRSGWNKKDLVEKQEARAQFCTFEKGQFEGCRTSGFAYTKVESEAPHLNMSGSSFASDQYSKEQNPTNSTDKALASLNSFFLFSVDSNDLIVSYKFANQAGVESWYQLTIRVSTLRFAESYEFENPDSKTEENGYCAKYGVIANAAP
jgi:hypothetical protein